MKSSKLLDQHSVERFFDVDALPELDEIGNMLEAFHGKRWFLLGNINLAVRVNLVRP